MKVKHSVALAFAAVFILFGTGAHAQTGVFTQDLYFGLQNNIQVSQLQEFLTAQGLYSGPITGNFYSLTLDAVKVFQTKEGIAPAAGYFGPLTIAVANKIAGANTSASPAQAASATEQLQLQALLREVALLQQQLQAQESSTQASQKTTITVRPSASSAVAPVSPMPTANITANGSSNSVTVPYGASVELSWNSTGADSCSISPGGWTGLSGNRITGSLDLSQIYSLSCSGAGVSVSSTVTVNVSPQTVAQSPSGFSWTSVGSPSQRGKSVNDEVADITFNPANGGAILLNTMTITFSGTAASSTGFLSGVKLLDPSGNTIPVSSQTADCNGPGTCSVTFDFDGRLDSGAQTYKLTVDDSRTAVAAGGGSVSLYVTINANMDVTYTDSAGGGGSLVTLPAILQPGNHIFPLNLNSVTYAQGT